MALNQTPPGGRYGPLTKSIDIGESLMLIDLARGYESVAAWQQEALLRLPQASRQRRQEIIASIRLKFLKIEGDEFAPTPFLQLVGSRELDGRFRRDLLLAQYLRATPLVWESIPQVVLPHAEAGSLPLAKEEDAEILQAEWDRFLATRLRQYTETTFSRTRAHLTAHLTKFGILEARSVPGDRIARRFFARFYEPDPRAFWFSLALEFSQQGWTSRSLDFVASGSWTRVAYCTKVAYARFAVEEAERVGLIVTDFFGSEKQVTFRGSDPVTKTVEAILHV